jgi:hypothetical protein
MKFLFGLERATSASRGLTKIARGGFVKSNSDRRLIHLYTFDFAKTRLTRRVLGASLQIKSSNKQDLQRVSSPKQQTRVRLNNEPDA